MPEEEYYDDYNEDQRYKNEFDRDYDLGEIEEDDEDYQFAESE